MSIVHRHKWCEIITMEQTQWFRTNHRVTVFWDTSHQPSMKFWESERRPTTSPVSRHVLVRPGISAYGSELCSSFPAPPTPPQKAKGIIAPLQDGSQRTVSPPPSTEKHKMTHSRVNFMSITVLSAHMHGSLSEGRWFAAGYKLNNLLCVVTNPADETWSVAAFELTRIRGLANCRL